MKSYRSEKNLFLTTLTTKKQKQEMIQQNTLQLEKCQKNADYFKASALKLNIQKLKKDIEENKLQQLILKQKREKRKLQKIHMDQLAQLKDKWTQKFIDFNCQNEKLKFQMQQRHLRQLTNAKLQIEKQIPTTIKQSSECLNLRKIEEQMKKQKKYAQAYQIQQQITQLKIKEETIFKKQRQMKIQTALNTIKNKLRNQIQVFNMKLSSVQYQLIKERQKQIQRTKARQLNSLRDLVSLQGKQLLTQKGCIKNRSALSVCRSRSKLSSAKSNR